MDSANNQVFNIFLCDDNIEHLHSLSHTILQLSTERHIQLTQFSSSQELLDYLYKTDNSNVQFPDLILMDIEMPEIDGITLGKKIKEISCDIRLVFVTAFAEYAIKGYEANAFRYLLKPVSCDDFRKLFADLEAENAKAKKIIIKSGDREILLPIHDIIYISAEDKYTIVYTKNNYYITDESLKQHESKLVPHGFFRIHRKYLANMYHHKSITGNKLLLGHNIELPLSRRKADDYKEHLFHIMKEDLL